MQVGSKSNILHLKEETKVKVKGNSLAGQSVLDVDTHKRADEVFRFFADVVPVGRVELKLPWKKR